MGNDRKVVLFNVLTIVVLVATVCLVGFYGLVAINVLNLFPTPTPIPPVSSPTPSETPTPVTPTRTPSPTPTITPTPGPTNTRTPTLTPSVTPTWPPTATPTPTPPRVTLSPWPFTYELIMRSPEYGCNWTGVAGHVQDLDGNPLMGLPVHVWGAGLDQVIVSGSSAHHNTVYGYQSAWELFYDANPKPMEVRVQLHDNQGRPISEEIVIEFLGYCNAALGYVVFTQNH